MLVLAFGCSLNAYAADYSYPNSLGSSYYSTSLSGYKAGNMLDMPLVKPNNHLNGTSVGIRAYSYSSGNTSFFAQMCMESEPFNIADYDKVMFYSQGLQSSGGKVYVIPASYTVTPTFGSNGISPSVTIKNGSTNVTSNCQFINGSGSISVTSSMSGSYKAYFILQGTISSKNGAALTIDNIISNSENYDGPVLTPLILVSKMTLKYDANGGTGAPSSSTHEKGSAATISSTKPTRTGYDFLGWSTSADSTIAEFVGGDTLAITENTTLYAVWKLQTPYFSAFQAPSDLTVVNLSPNAKKPMCFYDNFAGTIVCSCLPRTCGGNTYIDFKAHLM